MYDPDIHVDAINLNTSYIGGVYRLVWTVVFVLLFGLYSFRIIYYCLTILSFNPVYVAYIILYLSNTSIPFNINVEVSIVKLLSIGSYYTYVFQTLCFFHPVFQTTFVGYRK